MTRTRIPLHVPALALASLLWAAPAMAAIVLNWDFQTINGAAPQVNDASANGHDGSFVLTGAATDPVQLVNGGPDGSNALSFTGVTGPPHDSNGAFAASDPDFDLAALSVSVWFNSAGNTGTNQIIAGRWSDGTRAGWVIRMNAAGQVFGAFLRQGTDDTGGLAGNNSIVSAAAFDDGFWHHAVMTFEPGVGSRFFVDNVEITALNAFSYSNTNTTAAVYEAGNTSRFGVGAQFFNTPRGFTGAIDQVYLFDTAIDPGTINKLFNHSIPEPASATLLLTAVLLWRPRRRAAR